MRSEQVFGAICESGICCRGLSKTTSSEAISEAFFEFGLKPGNSP